MKNNMKPSEKCKMIGLKNLSEACKIMNRPTRTVIYWAENDPDFFELLLVSAANEKIRKIINSWKEERELENDNDKMFSRKKIPSR